LPEVSLDAKLPERLVDRSVASGCWRFVLPLDDRAERDLALLPDNGRLGTVAAVELGL
jgi:hypothetical protein